MNIVNIIPSYHPFPKGGSAYSQYQLNTSLIADNRIIVFTYHNKKETKYLNKNHIVHFGSFRTFLFSFEMFKAIKNSDIIHLSSLFFSLNFLVFIACKILRKPIIISPRGELFEAALKRRKKIKYLFLFLLLKIKSNQIFFHSTSDSERKTIELNINKYKFYNKVIPNSIELTTPLKINKKSQILFLGRINPIKSIESIINVMPNLDCKLIILGEALLDYEVNYKKELMKLIAQLGISEKVVFMGHLEGYKKNAILSESKVLILPSKSENFGNVVLESLIQGTPVIASLNTPWHELDERGCGFQIDTYNNLLLCSKIDYFINMDKKMLNEYSKKAYIYAEQFSNKEISPKWLSYYTRICKKPYNDQV